MTLFFLSSELPGIEPGSTRNFQPPWPISQTLRWKNAIPRCTWNHSVLQNGDILSVSSKGTAAQSDGWKYQDIFANTAVTDSKFSQWLYFSSMQRMILMDHLIDAGASHTAKSSLQKLAIAFFKNFGKPDWLGEFKTFHSHQNILDEIGYPSYPVVCRSPQNIQAMRWLLFHQVVQPKRFPSFKISAKTKEAELYETQGVFQVNFFTVEWKTFDRISSSKHQSLNPAADAAITAVQEEKWGRFGACVRFSETWRRNFSLLVYESVEEFAVPLTVPIEIWWLSSKSRTGRPKTRNGKLLKPA